MSGQRTHANPIWNFFLKVPAGGEAQGETCGVVLKTPTSTVTHLKKHAVTHLKKHPGKYKEYSEMHKLYSLPKKKSESKMLSSQLSVASMFKPKLQSSSIKAQEMTKKIAGFIAHGLQLYSMVEEESFEMTRCAIPEYVVLSQNMFSRTVIPNLAVTPVTPSCGGSSDEIQCWLQENLGKHFARTLDEPRPKVYAAHGGKRPAPISCI